MGMMIPITFNIEILDKEEFVRTVAEEYGREVEDLTDDDFTDFIEANIRGASSKRTDLFQVEGTDMDGWFVNCVDSDRLF